jgi:glycosyltransferase involved in cell wall biosynthesis
MGFLAVDREAFDEIGFRSGHVRLGIDLHNIRDGGGVNYMSNLMAAFQPRDHGFDEIVLFGSDAVLRQMPDRPEVIKIRCGLLGKSLPWRLWFLLTQLTSQLKTHHCDVLYSPGGLYFGRFRPFGTISRNMMPFDRGQWSMYPLGFDRLRLHLLRIAHAVTFSRADLMLFLTNTAREAIAAQIPLLRGEVAVVPHGVDRGLFSVSQGGSRSQARTRTDRLRIVYPSRLEPYKHQVEVVRAIASLRKVVPAIQLEFYGPANPAYLTFVRAEIATHDPNGEFLFIKGAVPNTDLPQIYRDADALLFASSCENLPNILFEGMAAGIPLICSNVQPMPEVVGDAAVYFDPRSPESIAAAVLSWIDHSSESSARIEAGLRRVQTVTWEICASRTFGLLGRLARSSESTVDAEQGE